MNIKLFVVFCLLFFLGCMPWPDQQGKEPVSAQEPVRVGAERMKALLPMLSGKNIGLVVHPASRVGKRHLVDTLLAVGIAVQKIFGPEHGFRGKAADGVKIANQRDPKTGLPILSLYGSQKKPTADDIAGLDLLVFDLQDVGARFYTYISTLHFVMEACAEEGVPLLVLDRPNPNGHYTDGPILEPEHRSFVGMHPVPVVHGLTVGELARMINGEGWLNGGIRCKLEVLPCENYTHQTRYVLSVPPSPNLPNMRAVYLYPSLAFFEGTVISVGRGTEYPFQWVGHPELGGELLFTPKPNEGSKHPPLEGQACRGWDLHRMDPLSVRESRQLDLGFLVEAYRQFPEKDSFFRADGYLEKLAGTRRLREQIESGWTAANIRKSWQEDLEAYRKQAEPYLLYEGFQ